MIITPCKCNQSSYMSCLPVCNSYYQELTGKRTELSISNFGYLEETVELHSTWYSNRRASPHEEAAGVMSCVHFTI